MSSVCRPSPRTSNQASAPEVIGCGPGGGMPQLRLTLLGGFQARNQAGEVLSVPSRKAQAMLAYLALPLGRAHPRDKLAALLVGGIREESARASLRQALFVVRKALQDADADALDQRADTLRLEPAHVDADVAAFELAAATGTPESLAQAASLYQGDLLAGLALDEAPFEEWLVSERERLRELALEVLARLLAHQRKSAGAERPKRPFGPRCSCSRSIRSRRRSTES